MQSIIEGLFYGRINPNSESQDTRYETAMNFKKKHYEKLISSLNGSEKEAFEKYVDTQNEIEAIMHCHTFTYAIAKDNLKGESKRHPKI